MSKRKVPLGSGTRLRRPGWDGCSVGGGKCLDHSKMFGGGQQISALELPSHISTNYGAYNS